MYNNYQNIPAERTIVVAGNSMSPTLRSLDVVTISTNNLRILPGDIIVFPSPKDNKKVVHRVISLGQQGIKTRGDNCILTDDWTVASQDVIGKVKSARRGNRQLHIYNGIAGQLIARVLFFINIFFYYIKRLFYPIYKTLWQSGILKNFLPKNMKPTVLSFKHQDGIELQLVMGQTIIGRCRPPSGGWIIKAPYRLFVDEDTLERIRISYKTHSATRAEDKVNK